MHNIHAHIRTHTHTQQHESATPHNLERGEQLSYTAKGEPEAVKRADPDVAIAWLEGRLQYRREPLRRVVDDVNRYSDRQIILDPAIADLEFTGTVFRHQVEEWTQGLRRIFPVEVMEVKAGPIMIRPEENPPSR